MTDFPMVELPVEGGWYFITTDLLDEPICATFEGGRFVVPILSDGGGTCSTLYIPQDMASIVERRD